MVLSNHNFQDLHIDFGLEYLAIVYADLCNYRSGASIAKPIGRDSVVQQAKDYFSGIVPQPVK